MVTDRVTGPSVNQETKCTLAAEVEQSNGVPNASLVHCRRDDLFEARREFECFQDREAEGFMCSFRKLAIL